MRHKCMVSDENRVRLDAGGHLLQDLFAELLANLGEHLALSVSWVHTSPDLLEQNTILRDQGFVVSQQFLIHSSHDICQQLLPIHTCCPSVMLPILSVSMINHAAEHKAKGSEW
jgi:hypothetical protein